MRSFAYIGVDGLLGDTPTYALSDIHGHYDQLERALAWIAEDSRNEPGTVVIFCGDYVDYGPHSRKVLNRLQAGPDNEEILWIFLVGNHEQMMLEALETSHERVWNGWMRSGGQKTIDNYILAPGSNASIDKVALDGHRKFLTSMGVSFEDKGRIFVHAGLRDIGRGHYTLGRQSQTEMLWIKPGDMDAAWPSRLKKLVVHGHTPFNRGVPGRRVCIDGGIGLKGGALIVAKFNDKQLEPTHTELFR